MKRRYALIAAISLLLMAVAAGWAYGYVFNSLVAPDNIVMTLARIQANRNLYISGVIAWGGIFVLDLLVTVFLYLYFRDVDAKLSSWTGIARGIYTGFLGTGIVYLFASIHAADTGNAENLSYTLTHFETFWSWGLIIFGIHLAGLALLSFRSAAMPNIFGWLLVVAGVSYILVHGGKAVAPQLSTEILTMEKLLSLPMAAGELALAFWLLIKGGKS